MILAEELDADFAQVVIKHAPANDKLYANPLFGIQVTGNSNSIRVVLGAAARGRRRRARHADCSRSRAVAGRCGKLHALQMARSPMPRAAASSPTASWPMPPSKLPVPEEPPLKDPKDFTLIGKPLKRLDTPDKSTARPSTASTPWCRT